MYDMASNNLMQMMDLQTQTIRTFGHDSDEASDIQEVVDFWCTHSDVEPPRAKGHSIRAQIKCALKDMRAHLDSL